MHSERDNLLLGRNYSWFQFAWSLALFGFIWRFLFNNMRQTSEVIPNASQNDRCSSLQNWFEKENLMSALRLLFLAWFFSWHHCLKSLWDHWIDFNFEAAFFWLESKVCQVLSSISVPSCYCVAKPGTWTGLVYLLVLNWWSICTFWFGIVTVCCMS